MSAHPPAQSLNQDAVSELAEFLPIAAKVLPSLIQVEAQTKGEQTYWDILAHLAHALQRNVA
tara:strand:- start:49 stop:234 length:186 start_codon:yes stop_codon:yes gene_type:complete